MLEYWYQALSSPSGICLRASDRERCRNQLYSARAAAADDSLKAISIVLSPTSTDELWLVKTPKVTIDAGS